MGWETINGGKVLADKKIQSSQKWAIAFQIHTPPPTQPRPLVLNRGGGGWGSRILVALAQCKLVV